MGKVASSGTTVQKIEIVDSGILDHHAQVATVEINRFRFKSCVAVNIIIFLYVYIYRLMY